VEWQLSPTDSVSPAKALAMPRVRSKSQRQYVPQNDAGKIASALEEARGERMPKFIVPCLAIVRDKVPMGDQLLHEIKFDGYRLQLHKRENDVRFYARRGHDWSKRFSSLIQSAWYLPVTHLILDGEVIVRTASGHSDFGSLEDDLGTGRSDRFVYFVFDILHINGIWLRDCALVDRKSVLVELLRGQTGPIRF
jgi:bifunctional non-homologous end joining protein LigD